MPSTLVKRSILAILSLATASLLLYSVQDRAPGQAKTQLDRHLLGFVDPNEHGSAETRPGILHNSLVPASVFPKVIDSKIQWDTSKETPQTVVVQHVTGWTILENLYSYNGTFFLVTDAPDDFPPIREMISTGYPMHSDPYEPADVDMRIISTREAEEFYGRVGSHIAGVSFIATDSPQFFGHYYHFCAEILFGLWRTYSSLDPYIEPSGNTFLPAPNRLIFPNVDHRGWRDEAEMNAVVVRSAFPSASVETSQDWQDRAVTEQLFLYDLVVLTERTAATRGANYSADDKMAAMAHRLPGNQYWWTPIRTNVLEVAGLDRDVNGRVYSESKPVITYVVRQGRGRALNRQDHRALVTALLAMEKEYDWEVNIVLWERFKKTEQIKIAGRSTILLGVHGNGLTHLLWMIPSPSATVIEIFQPGGFASDYQFPAAALGIQHYTVWNDTYLRSDSPMKPRRQQPTGFHGNEIPVHAPTVIDLIVERISDPLRLSTFKPRSEPLDWSKRAQALEGLAGEDANVILERFQHAEAPVLGDPLAEGDTSIDRPLDGDLEQDVGPDQPNDDGPIE